MMSSKLDWTTKLGDAVLAQQPDVMDAIQRMRARADANNKLTSTKEQRVTKTQSQGGKQVIAIEQTNPDTLYVPYYDPAVVYGGWPYPAYPPYYFGYPGYIGAGIIATGLAFGAGWALGRWGAGGNYWGGAINWNGNINNININRPKVNPLGGNNFQHRPEHRQGVRYNNSNVRQQFGNNNRGGVQNRMDFRGRGGNQVLRPGGGRRSTATWRAARRGAAAISTAERGSTAFATAERRSTALATAERRTTALATAGRRQCARQHRLGPSRQSPVCAGSRQHWRRWWRRLPWWRRRWRFPRRRRWRFPRRWWWRLSRWRWRRPALGYQTQARYRSARPPAERPWLLSVQLQWQRPRLRGRDGPGG